MRNPDSLESPSPLYTAKYHPPVKSKGFLYTKGSPNLSDSPGTCSPASRRNCSLRLGRANPMGIIAPFAKRGEGGFGALWEIPLQRERGESFRVVGQPVDPPFSQGGTKTRCANSFLVAAVRTKRRHSSLPLAPHYARDAVGEQRR